MWQKVTKFDPRACALADRHYSRRTPGSNQFMPPGQTVVFLWDDGTALFGWHRPHPRSGVKTWHGLDGWTCTIFRNEGNALSSDLILSAELMLAVYADSCGPGGLLTYVWDKKVRSPNPGFCFLAAGWRRIGRSADGKKTLLQKLLV